MHNYLYHVLNSKLKYMHVKTFIVDCIDLVYILYVTRRYLVNRIKKNGAIDHMERLRYNTSFYEVFHTKNKEEQHKIKKEWGDVIFYQIYMQSIFQLSKVMCLLSLHSNLVYQQCIGYTA